MKDPILITGCVADKSIGIYQIQSTTNGKKYVGGSVNIGKRMRSHLRELQQ